MDFLQQSYLNLKNRVKMENEQNQQILQQSHMPTFAKSIALCLVMSTCRFLLILFSQVASSQRSFHISIVPLKEDEIKPSFIKQIKQNYFILLALIYLAFYIALFTLPLLFLTLLSITYSLLTALLLVFFFAEILPRFILRLYEPTSIVGRWMWIVLFAKLINQVIPLNEVLYSIFRPNDEKSETNGPLITKKNVYKLLDLNEAQQKPIKQQHTQLLSKLRHLSDLPAKTMIIPRSNIFLLEVEQKLTAKLLNHLSKYYFSKLLVYSKSKRNIYGYLQFKQLLSFEVNQKFSSQIKVIKTNLVKMQSDDSLFVATQRMIQQKVNFALVYEQNQLLGLIKLKDVFSELVIKWYNYDGLTAQRSFNSFASHSFIREKEVVEGEEQH